MAEFIVQVKDEFGTDLTGGTTVNRHIVLTFDYFTGTKYIVEVRSTDGLLTGRFDGSTPAQGGPIRITVKASGGAPGEPPPGGGGARPPVVLAPPAGEAVAPLEGEQVTSRTVTEPTTSSDPLSPSPAPAPPPSEPAPPPKKGGPEPV